MNSSFSTHAVKAIVKDDKGRVLFLKNSPLHGRQIIWDLPGGLVEENEDPVRALKREIKEELGVSCSVGSKVGDWHFIRLSDEKMVTVTNYHVQLGSESIILSSEHTDYHWISKKDINNEYEIKDKSLVTVL